MNGLPVDINLSYATLPPPARRRRCAVRRWDREVREEFAARYGAKEGEALLQRVKKFVKGRRELASILQHRGIGSRPDVVQLLADHVFRRADAPRSAIRFACSSSCLRRRSFSCRSRSSSCASRSRVSRAGSSRRARFRLRAIDESVRNRYKKYKYKIVPSVRGRELLRLT
jgi:hypothetical protein